MHRRTVLTGAAAIAALASSSAYAQSSADGPIQHYIMIDVQPDADLLAVDRWYINHHAPETLARTQRAQSRYVSYRTYAVSDADATRFNVARGRMTEIAFETLAAFRAGLTPDARARVAITPPTAAAAFTTDTVTMRVAPTRTFKDEPTPERAAPYLRWIMFLRSPEGVSAAAFDAWITDQLGPAFARVQQPRRVLRFDRVGAISSQEFSHVLEVWFESWDDWRTAVSTIEQAMPAPPWTQSFPHTPMRSCFIGERPDLDFKTQDCISP